MATLYQQLRRQDRPVYAPALEGGLAFRQVGHVQQPFPQLPLACPRVADQSDVILANALSIFACRLPLPGLGVVWLQIHKHDGDGAIDKDDGETAFTSCD